MCSLHFSVGTKHGGCDTKRTRDHREAIQQAERLPRLSLKPTGLADGFGEGVTYSTKVEIHPNAWVPRSACADSARRMYHIAHGHDVKAT